MSADNIAASSAAPPKEVLIFKLGEEEYGIDIQTVQELRGCEPVTRIANAPAHMCGVINLRGVVVPIIDMRVRLGLAPSIAQANYDNFTVVAVLNLGRRTLGMVVDSVSDVIALDAEQIRPVPPGALGTGHWTGMGMLDERMVILLDIAGLMADENIKLTNEGAVAQLAN